MGSVRVQLDSFIEKLLLEARLKQKKGNSSFFKVELFPFFLMFISLFVRYDTL